MNFIFIFTIDINECEDSEICGDNQICTNTIGSYTVSTLKMLNVDIRALCL
jgi:hypothetical protein